MADAATPTAFYIVCEDDAWKEAIELVSPIVAEDIYDALEAWAKQERDCYQPRECSHIVRVYVRLEGETYEAAALHHAIVDEAEPECESADGHDWQHTRTNGHGGGVLVTNTCAHCRLVSKTDTWAQCPEDGTQGHRTETYSYPE